MNINIITIMRTPEYIHQTLNSLFSSDWEGSVVNLIVGSPNDQYVSGYAHDSRINIVRWETGADTDWGTQSPERISAKAHRRKASQAVQIAESVQLPLQNRASMNAVEFRRLKTIDGDRRWNVGLAKIVALEYSDALLFCEDDIRFNRDWFSVLQQLINELPTDQDYALNLAKGDRLAKDTVLIGSQCIYFSSQNLRFGCATWLRQMHSGSHIRGCSDFLMGNFINTHATLYTRKLVTHIGQVSSIG